MPSMTFYDYLWLYGLVDTLNIWLKHIYNENPKTLDLLIRKIVMQSTWSLHIRTPIIRTDTQPQLSLPVSWYFTKNSENSDIAPFSCDEKKYIIQQSKSEIYSSSYLNGNYVCMIKIGRTTRPTRPL